MKITFENTASYEGKLTVGGKELKVTLERGQIVLKGLPPGRETVGSLVAKLLRPILFDIMQAEAVVSEENVDVFGDQLTWTSLGNEKREVIHRLGLDQRSVE